MNTKSKRKMGDLQRVHIAAKCFEKHRPKRLPAFPIILTFLIGLAWQSPAELVTPATARDVAQGWVNTVIRVRGSWGGSTDAQVREVRPLREEGLLVGYYCKVQTGGYVVVSPYEGLSPVKAFATTGQLNPDISQGMADVIKLRLHRLVQVLEQKVGPLDRASSAQIKAQLKNDFSGQWQTMRLTVTPSRVGGPSSGEYLGGRVLLSTAWEQDEPYNSQCPSGGSGCTNTLVGCVSLAAAQIMRHWSWPSWGRTYPYNDEAYDWPHMPDRLWINSSSPTEVNAVARLCHHAGMASGADYGCGNTKGYLWLPGVDSMDDAFDEQFRYDVGGFTTPPGYGPMKDELNRNQPIQYAISTSWTGGHSFVVDGWMEFASPSSRWLHVNYGWGGGEANHLAWVNADEDMPESDGGWPDLRLDNVVPENALDSHVAGEYTKGDWPAYRYFNVDATGDAAIFDPGQSLQFLPTVRLTGTAPDGNAITIRGTAGDTTRLLSKGDRSRGIAIYEGAIRLANGGKLSLVPLLPPRYLDWGYNSNTRKIEIGWERPYGHDTTTVVERKVSSGTNSTWVIFGTVPSTETFYGDADVKPGNRYTYRLRSAEGNRLSEPSREADCLVPSA
jgi:hypothetical protein